MYHERQRSHQYLHTALKQNKPPAQTILEQMNTTPKEAVEQEACEPAAELRDRIHALQRQRRT